jgi:hypothetical protein
MAAFSGLDLPESLDHAKILALPNTAYYLPNFITEDEERAILEKVRATRTLSVSYLAASMPKHCAI